MPNKTFSIREAAPAKLTVPVTGIPQPQFTWSKDERDIKEDTRIAMESTTASVTLVLKEVRREDAGM